MVMLTFLSSNELISSSMYLALKSAKPAVVILFACMLFWTTVHIGNIISLGSSSRLNILSGNDRIKVSMRSIPISSNTKKFKHYFEV
jgi:hypothetical protein